MVCVCGHKKTDHITGRDYGRNGYQCMHKDTLKDGAISFCKKQCMMYERKTKEANGQ